MLSGKVQPHTPAGLQHAAVPTAQTAHDEGLHGPPSDPDPPEELDAFEDVQLPPLQTWLATVQSVQMLPPVPQLLLAEPPWHVLVTPQHPVQFALEHPPRSLPLLDPPLELPLLFGPASTPLLLAPELEPPLLPPEPDPPLLGPSEPASAVEDATDRPPHPKSDIAKNSPQASSPRPRRMLVLNTRRGACHGRSAHGRPVVVIAGRSNRSPDGRLVTGEEGEHW